MYSNKEPTREFKRKGDILRKRTSCKILTRSDAVGEPRQQGEICGHPGLGDWRGGLNRIIKQFLSYLFLVKIDMHISGD